MRIEISNSFNQIHSVFYNVNKLALNLYINFQNKWPEFYWITGGITELYVHEKDSFDMDKVTFIPENATEERLLDCINFDLLNKDQLWTIFVAEELYKKGEVRQLIIPITEVPDEY